MMMKYFRFLYGETGRCFIHFGEIRDTKTEEHFTFLYLRGVRQHVKQEESEHTLFLCPKRLDMVVLGDAEKDSLEALKELSKSTEVETLICSANLYFANSHFAKLYFASTETIPGIKKVVCLTDKEGDSDGKQSYQVKAAGWTFTARCCGNGAVMLAHDLAGSVPENAGSMESGETPGSRPERTSRYKDCVLGVKIVSEDKRCCCEEEPDGYGCALGCTLHQDYDVCNYQRKDAGTYALGTVLLPEGTGDAAAEGLLRGIKEEFSNIRFFGLPGSISPKGLKSVVEGIAQDTGDDRKSLIGDNESSGAAAMPGYKRYFIGADSVLSDETIAAVSRSSMYHIPAVLKPGRALCCSGLLKYSE